MEKNQRVSWIIPLLLFLIILCLGGILWALLFKEHSTNVPEASPRLATSTNSNTTTPLSPSTGQNTTIPTIKTGTCTSTPTEAPKPLSGIQVKTFSAPLVSPTPASTQANTIKTFSLSGLQKKTEKNSWYAEIRKTDGGLISGYDTTLELCNEQNQGSFWYLTANQTEKDIISPNISASEHFLHGGAYAFAPGGYRADVYVKDLGGKWHLVAREEGLTIVP